MKQRAYAIRDTKAESYGTPFYQPTHGAAERSFSSLVHDEQSTISRHPEDYDLYYIGEYDTNLGLFTALDTPQHIAKAIHLKNASL